MKKTKYLRTWLVAALLVTIIASLTGGTVAWFTDNVEVTNNVIKSGTLDIDIELKDGTNWISLEKEPETKIFDYDLWEPGYTQVETLTIVNRGNLALEYMLNVSAPAAEVFTFEGKELTLANAIDVYMAFGEKTPASFADISEANGWWKAGNLADLMTKAEGFTQGAMLPSGKTDAPDGLLQTGLMQGECTCTVALHMQEKAGNEYQNRSLGNLGFILQAKQYMYEEDAFDNTYDEDAEYGPGSIISTGLVADVTSLPIPAQGAGEAIYPPSFPFETPTEYTTADLDLILKFSATESADEAAAGEYSDWHADFIVYADKDVPANSVMLAGQYDYNEDLFPWIGLTADQVITANSKIRLVGEAGLTVNYKEVCTFKDFYCGAMDITGENAGTKITVELWLFEATGGSIDSETGEKIKVGTFTHTF